MDGLRRLRIEGRMIDGGAILDETGRMIGSILVCDFPDRTALDAYLRGKSTHESAFGRTSRFTRCAGSTGMLSWAPHLLLT
jgi:hypothetical protein